jgi:threonylcarbamoyladenosine tRNA methylthiotransferase MtaB
MKERIERIQAHVLGCKVNRADSERILGLLPQSAEEPLALVSTCCVTAEAVKQSRKEVRRSLKRVGTGGKVFVTGCAVRLDPEPFSALGGNVTVVTGEPGEVAEEIKGEAARGETGARAPAGGRTRALIKVQDGCANRCAYCVIPQVRGKPRSRSAADVLAEARARAGQGFAEVVLSGINLGAYRDQGVRLPQLIEMITAVEGIRRVRLSSIEAVHVDRELLEAMASSHAVCPHLHIPLQSGDAGVLSAMGRRYGPKAFLERMELARSLLEDVNLTTDVIAGFPGEDGPAFENTMSLVRQAGFTRVHVFPFSARPGTRAVGMPGEVPSPERRRRARRLRELSDILGDAHRRRKLGLVDEILLESEVEPGVFSGYSPDYTRYLVEGGACGKLMSVRGDSVIGEAVRGKVTGHG